MNNRDRYALANMAQYFQAQGWGYPSTEDLVWGMYNQDPRTIQARDNTMIDAQNYLNYFGNR